MFSCHETASTAAFGRQPPASRQEGQRGPGSREPWAFDFSSGLPDTGGLVLQPQLTMYFLQPFRYPLLIPAGAGHPRPALGIGSGPFREGASLVKPARTLPWPGNEEVCLDGLRTGLSAGTSYYLVPMGAGDTLYSLLSASLEYKDNHTCFQPSCNGATTSLPCHRRPSVSGTLQENQPKSVEEPSSIISEVG